MSDFRASVIKRSNKVLKCLTDFGYTVHYEISETSSVYLKIEKKKLGVFAIIRLSNHKPRKNWERKKEKCRWFRLGDSIYDMANWVKQKENQIKKQRTFKKTVLTGE